MDYVNSFKSFQNKEKKAAEAIQVDANPQIVDEDISTDPSMIDYDNKISTAEKQLQILRDAQLVQKNKLIAAAQQKEAANKTATANATPVAPTAPVAPVA